MFGRKRKTNEIKAEASAFRPKESRSLQRKVVILIGRKEADGFHLVKRLKVKEPAEYVMWRGKTYLIQGDKIAYLMKGTPHYVFDVDTALPLTFGGGSSSNSGNSMSSDFVDIFARRQVMRQLVMAIQRPKFDWMTLIIGAIMGAAIGITIGIYLAPHLLISPPVVQHPGPAVNNSTSTSVFTNTRILGR